MWWASRRPRRAAARRSICTTSCASAPRSKSRRRATTSPLVESAPHSVLIAGGIGVTPIWSMLRRLVALGASWELHYASPTRKDAAFLDELQQLAAADPSRVNLAFSHEPGGRRLDLDEIVASSPLGLAFLRLRPRADARRLRKGDRRIAARAGPSGALRRRWRGDLASADRISKSRSRGPTRRFRCPPTSRSSTCCSTRAWKSPFSCMDGVCGSCKVQVLEGMPDHRDVVLDAEERAANGSMMVCCSRALSERLVLNL